MKSLYYRSQTVSPLALVGLSVLAVAALAIVEVFPKQIDGSDRAIMVAASRKAESAFEVIRRQRDELGLRSLPSQDPAGTGLLGPSMSLVTSLPGHLDAKQTSANPNFAAVVVNYLRAAGVKAGDRVAIGCTGSFPALNIAVLAAAETMELEVSLISSAASSQYGANHPRQMWPDMERRLADEGVIKTRSIAVSRGGFRDNAAGMTDETRHRLEAAITRGGRPLLNCSSIDDSIDRRMRLLRRSTGDEARFAAYINVGGGSASVGGTRGNEQLGHGFIRPGDVQTAKDPIDSVAMRFLDRGVPVINMIHVVTMAKEHGLPIASSTRPVVGEGGVYASRGHRKSFAGMGLFMVLIATSLVMRPPAWLRASLQWIAFRRDSSSASNATWML
jgi:poly-gamma-glutamate system protein